VTNLVRLGLVSIGWSWGMFWSEITKNQLDRVVKNLVLYKPICSNEMTKNQPVGVVKFFIYLHYFWHNIIYIVYESFIIHHKIYKYNFLIREGIYKYKFISLLKKLLYDLICAQILYSSTYCIDYIILIFFF
jgi:hypothetical protein